MHSTRVFRYNERINREGTVLYWMSRDQRVEDNYALIYAQQIALQQQQSLMVVFCLNPKHPYLLQRHVHFMLKGLQEVENKLKAFTIPFILRIGEPDYEIEKIIHELSISVVVTDFSPLRKSRKVKETIAKRIAIPLIEIDTHNVVPARVVSTKQEYAARTIRPKIHRLLPNYLVEIPTMLQHPFQSVCNPKNSWERAYTLASGSVSPVQHVIPGSDQARYVLHDFIKYRLDSYAADRNDPTKNALSGLSVYLHYGQISAQRVAIEVTKSNASVQSKEAYMEELIVRKELSDNYCFYNEYYDSPRGYPDWALKSLQKHDQDPRDVIYTYEQFEAGKTHDPVWNAAQIQMVDSGIMHGYMRMYWAKKILEWTKSFEEAHSITLRLNDTYSLDGRDPNGYVGVAWSIGGVHDRPWRQRSVFGTVRYMSRSGLEKKFDTTKYIDRWLHDKMDTI